MKLNAWEVSRIVIKGTMTPTGEHYGPKQELEARREAGYNDHGYHYLIDEEGTIHSGILNDTKSSALPRYASTAVCVLIAGDGDYTHDQLVALHVAVKVMKYKYVDAKVCLYKDLYRGNNPPLEHEDYRDL